MHSRTDNYTYLTTAPIRKVIPTMAVPTIISMLVTGMYNMADTFFVGQLDTPSTAAVGVVFSLMFLMQAFGFFFGHGSGSYIARELGARRQGNARRMATNGFVLSFLLGVAFTVLGLVFLRPLSLALGSTPTILPLTERYLGISLLGIPFLTSSLTLNNQLRLQGNAAYAMVGIVTGAIINVALDPLLIFTLGMGIQGAALATVIGQVISFCILIRMSHHNGNIGVHWREFSLSLQDIKEIFYGGSPSLMRQGLLCISTTMLNHGAGVWGDEAIASMTIVGRITMLVMAVVIGLGQGFQPLCGFCYGAGLHNRLKRAWWFTVGTGTVFLLCVSALGCFFSADLIAIFRNDAGVIAIGVVALRWQLSTIPLNATIMASNMITQTCRKPWRANVLAAARNGLFFIPLIVLLPRWFGLKGIEMCQSWSDILAFLITVPIMVYTLRELSLPGKAQPQTGKSSHFKSPILPHDTEETQPQTDKK